MIAGDIITKARYSLSDNDKDRWSDARLLSLLNDALVDMAVTTKLYHSTSIMKLQQNIAEYNLSSTIIELDRIEYLGKPLCQATYAEMDAEFGLDWQTETGETPTHAVYDLKVAGRFRVYPFTTTLGGVDLSASSSSYGVITKITYEDIKLEVNGDFGDVAGINEAEYLKLYHTTMPTKATELTTELDSFIDETLVMCLVHYIVGTALRDNIEPRDRQIGNDELQLYNMAKEKLMTKRMQNGANTARIAAYRNGWDS